MTKKSTNKTAKYKILGQFYFDNSSLDILHQQTKYLPDKLVTEDFLFLYKNIINFLCSFQNENKFNYLVSQNITVIKC